MFSREDWRRAVDLHFMEGMTIRKVVTELGYPSEGALAKWVREDPRYPDSTCKCNGWFRVGLF